MGSSSTIANPVAVNEMSNPMTRNGYFRLKLGGSSGSCADPWCGQALLYPSVPP